MDESGFKDGAGTLPSEISRLSSTLAKLVFYEPTFRPISSLPPELFNLTKFETLILSYVDLKTLPEAIVNCLCFTFTIIITWNHSTLFLA